MMIYNFIIMFKTFAGFFLQVKIIIQNTKSFHYVHINIFYFLSLTLNEDLDVFFALGRVAVLIVIIKQKNVLMRLISLLLNMNMRKLIIF